MRLILVAAMTSGCVVPFAIPPLRGEVGGTALVGQAPAIHVAGGAALASASLRRDQGFDVGAGGFIDAEEHATLARGAYVDTAMFIDRGERTRTSLGVRGELRFAGGAVGPGAKLRIDHEFYGAAKRGFTANDHCGAATGTYHGTAAIGVYSEVGRIWQPDGMSTWTASAGISMRIPATIGVWIGIPGCK